MIEGEEKGDFALCGCVKEPIEEKESLRFVHEREKNKIL